MRVHLHTVCWNDAPRLEYFFRHYEPWVEKFFVHDDGSDDGSREILEARPDVSVERLVRSREDSWVLSAKAIYDTSWQRSRQEADWVIVANVDEHLHHADMASYLTQCLEDGVTAIPALGYQMVSEDLPAPGALLWRDYPMGAPWVQMSKLQIFRPDKILETDFSPGRHRVKLDGQVVLPKSDRVVNLHYKYMGKKEIFERHAEQEQRHGETDRKNSWGHKYRWSWEEYDADFRQFQASAVDTGLVDHSVTHQEPRWWRSLS